MKICEEMLKALNTYIQRLETIDYYKLKKEYREFEDLSRSFTLEESCKADNWRQVQIAFELFEVWVNYDDILDGDMIRPERRYKMAKRAIEALDKLIELGYDMTKITKE